MDNTEVEKVILGTYPNHIIENLKNNWQKEKQRRKTGWRKC